MENKFDNSDFEHFVKQNADQYRMFPSDKVWKGINSTLHSKRRWYGIGIAFLLISTAAVTGIMLSPSSNKQQLVTANSNPAILKNIKGQTPASDFIIAPVQNINKNKAPLFTPDNTQKNLFTSLEVIVEKNSELVEDLQSVVITPAISDVSALEKINSYEQLTKVTPKQFVNKSLPVLNNDNIVFGINKNLYTENTIKEIPKENKTDQTVTPIKDIYPMTIESVVNAYEYKRPSKKLVWQIYITPSVTYRELDDNKPFLAAARNSIGASNVYSFSDINSQVTHKPDLGVQLGFSAGYPLTKNITIKAGLQFNVSKYNIRASTTGSEVATIALNTPGGGTNSVSTITNYRNVGGYRSAWLHNKYVSASVPVGAEIKLSGSKKTIVGIGATVQPTYVLGNRAYLLSTDLKNYAEVPSLTRKWNINTGFEVFAGYKTKDMDWRIGPQVRYQIFSSFDDSYPIKEHLFDFGIKLGVTLK